MIELKKGTIIKEIYDFVVVKIGFDGRRILLYCIDCHANNTYVLNLADLVMNQATIMDPLRKYDEIPDPLMAVVGEVLAGQHDGRWGEEFDSEYAFK